MNGLNGLGLRTVVFATDFSELSRHAGRAAADLAHHFGARLHVLHVDPLVTAPVASSRLAEAAAELGTGLDVTTATTSGAPARRICAYALGVGADLIVVGTHGRTGVSRVLLGSVAEGVVRHSACPVMSIPGVVRAPAKAEAEAAAVAEAATAGGHCVVCAWSSPDLICAACRAVIRGEALQRKRAEEKPAQPATLR